MLSALDPPCVKPEKEISIINSSRQIITYLCKVTFDSREAIQGDAVYQSMNAPSGSRNLDQRLLGKGSEIGKSPKDLQWSALICRVRKSRKKKKNIPVERVKVGFRACPQRIFARIVLRIDHSPINPTVKVGKNR